jgi:ribosomal protein S18 acetylase RimI-like enzyme
VGKQNPSVIVDCMAPSESEAVNELFADVVRELPYYNAAAKTSELKQHSAEVLQNLVTADRHAVLVARTDHIVGFCFSRYDDGLIWISWFGVKKAFRRQKVASALLTAVEHTVVERGCHKIWCDSRTNNEPSINILTTRQYQKICSVRNHWYGLDFILWEKVIG